MNKPEILSALEPLVEVFGKMGIDYYIGGSIASSAFGLPRTTLDIDIVADVKASQAKDFVNALKHEYYVDQNMIEEAIRRNSSFNLIHNSTCFKIGGSTSERQINDIRGIIKVQGDKLDFDYLKDTAIALKLSDILTKVLNE